MILDVTRHPDYPFQDERRARIEARATRFLDAPDAAEPEAAVLRDFLVRASAFAFLERIVQGEVLCDLPAHVSRILAAGRGDPEEEGERLAEAEEDLLEWRAGSIDSLAEALDGIGVKVFLFAREEGEEERRGGEEPGDLGREARAREIPAEVAAGRARRQRSGRNLFGAFCFESDVGPAILVGADAQSAEAAFVLAHEFGHLVADVDPYRSRFCRWCPRSLAPGSPRPEELRADRFARALLMPARALLRTLGDLGPVGSGGDEERVSLLAALFSAPAALVRRRLADFGVLTADRGTAAAPDRSDMRSRARGGSEYVPLPLPERYVNLALAAYGGRVLTPEVLGRFLRTSEVEALRLADWAGVRPQPDGAE